MAEKVYKNRVKEKYEKEVVPYLMKKFGYKSVMQCPRLVKIVINTGLGDIKDNAKSVQIAQGARHRRRLSGRRNPRQGCAHAGDAGAHDGRLFTVHLRSDSHV